MTTAPGWTSGLRGLANLPFEPLLTGGILAVLFAPSAFRERVFGALHLSSPRAVQRVLTGLEVLVAIGAVFKVNKWLSDRMLNNWVLDKYNWDSEIAVVTGGSNGIGQNVVESLAKQGVKVIILDIRAPSWDTPANVKFYECDVTSAESVSKIATEIRASHGDPTILINNAGIGTYKVVLDTTDEDVHKAFNINIISHFTLIREFLPAMIRNNHGHVIGVASMASFLGVQGIVPYCCTKAGVMAFYEGIAQELRHTHKAPKVRASTIHPGWTRTGMIAPKEQFLTRAKVPIMSVDEVGKAIVQHVLEGKSGRVVIGPGSAIAPGLRGLPLWFQDLIKNESASQTG